MTTVIVTHEKHGTFTYESALSLVKQRLDDGYWYYDEAKDEAQTVVDGGSEDTAWAFLESRKDVEYEYVEKQTVR